MQIFFIVVLYNKTIASSRTCQALASIEETFGKQHIYIFDNSTIKSNNKLSCLMKQWNYMSTGQNLGLSRAYNLSIKEIKLIGNVNDVVVLLDDDTEISIEYYKKLCSLMQDISIDIAVPYIIDQKGVIISPDNAGILRNKFIKNKNEAYNLDKFNAINSCTVVRLGIFDQYSYDETLFLDLVDNKFFEDQRTMNRKFGIIDCEIRHNVQLNSENDLKKILLRYKIRVRDYKAYSRVTRVNVLMQLCKILAWSCLELYRHKNILLSYKIFCLFFASNDINDNSGDSNEYMDIKKKNLAT